MADYEPEVGEVEAEETPSPEDIFSGSQVQEELSADDAYLWVVGEVKQTYPDIETTLANDPALAQQIYGDAQELFG